MIFRPLALVLLAAFTTVTAAARPPTVAVAAAANLTYVIQALNQAFRAEAPGVTVTTTLGSSGNLSAQIRNGAPFDVFLSADTDYPRALARSGFGDAATLRTFAVGRLAFWTVRPDLDIADIAAVVRAAAVKRIAIAQPRTAPYGRAAQAVLAKLGLQADAGAKLVVGENIAQTAEFVQTGNADAGFVALSFLKSPRLANRGKWVVVAPELYAPVSLEHAAILTARATGNAAAHRYLAFLHSPTARRILAQAGYGLPAQD